MKRIRIWVYWRESIVRITLLDGEPLELYSGGPTDEGFHHECHRYEYNAADGVVISSISTSSRDCDGRFDDFREFYWCVGSEMQPMRDVVNGEVVDLPESGPVWERGAAWQRDFSAEAAGY